MGSRTKRWVVDGLYDGVGGGGSGYNEMMNEGQKKHGWCGLALIWNKDEN